VDISKKRQDNFISKNNCDFNFAYNFWINFTIYLKLNIMDIKSSKELIEKINELKEKVVDLSADEDLALAVMNLISMEEHLYFTAEKQAKMNILICLIM
jgi:hypothetical protein